MVFNEWWAYSGHHLTDCETNYHSSELECLALIWAIQHIQLYPYGHHFTAVTDNSSLVWLQSKRDLTFKLAQWVLLLQEYDLVVIHHSGKHHTDADSLSRHPVGGAADMAHSDIVYCSPVLNLTDSQS